jgi:hypothetical protein
VSVYVNGELIVNKTNIGSGIPLYNGDFVLGEYHVDGILNTVETFGGLMSQVTCR